MAYHQVTLAYSAVAAATVNPATLEALMAGVALDYTTFDFLGVSDTNPSSDTTSAVGTTVTRTIVLALTPAYTQGDPNGDAGIFQNLFTGELEAGTLATVVAAAPVLA